MDKSAIIAKRSRGPEDSRGDCHAMDVSAVRSVHAVLQAPVPAYGGKAPFCGENLGLVTRFSVRVRLWAGYAPPAAMAAPDICVGNMAPFAGIEPAASGFGDRRSSNMS